MSEDTKLTELIINTLSPEQMPEVLSDTEIYLVEDDVEYASVEELATKQDIIQDLATIRSNASTGAELAPQVAVNTQRIEDLTTAKFPNVVIIGTPHIEGGQVTNYSDTSYLQFPFVDISRGQPFDIYFSFTTANDVTTQQNILDSYFGIALAIKNGKGIMSLSSNGTNWNIGTSTGTNTLLPNTTYYVKYSWTGTAYSASLSTNDTEYVPDMNLTSSLSPHKTTIFIGGSPNLFGPSTAHPFKGTINFNKSKVVVNGITVWEGMADVGLASRANVSLNNLDEVGEARFNAKQDVIADLDMYVKNTDYAGSDIAGVIKASASYATQIASGYLRARTDTLEEYKSGNNNRLIGKGTLENIKEDLVTSIGDTKYQNKLTAGENITIENDVISAKGGGGLEIGDIGTALYIDETQGKRRRLNGSILAINENTQGFVDWLKNIITLNPSLSTTEENWQSELTLSKLGQCGKFVIDEVAGTVRLPKVVNIQGLQDLTQAGVRVDESLPNINGTINPVYGHRTDFVTGAFEPNATTNFGIQAGGGGVTVNGSNIRFDASRSSSTYQDNASVQQEAVQYPFFIQIATGAETEVNIVNEIELNNPCSFGDYKYSDVEINNLSWLRSQGQWNSRAVYVDYYNWILSNANNNVDKFKKSTDEYTDYDWVVNTTDETFRLPLLPMERVVVETGEENGIKYRIYNDGYCEQWQYINTQGNRSVTLAKQYKDTTYWVACQARTNATGDQSAFASAIINKTTNGFLIRTRWSSGSNTGDAWGDTWMAGGYLANFESIIKTDYKYYYVGETIQNAKLVDIGRIQEHYATKDFATASSFPSNRYVDLTLGASGSTYTAPANGYFLLNKKMGATNKFLYMFNTVNQLASEYYSPVNSTGKVNLPVSKGDVIQVNYDASGETNYFRFIYAEGEA